MKIESEARMKVSMRILSVFVVPSWAYLLGALTAALVPGNSLLELAGAICGASLGTALIFILNNLWSKSN